MRWVMCYELAPNTCSKAHMLSRVRLLAAHGLQHARLPCPSHLPEFAQTHVH